MSAIEGRAAGPRQELELCARVDGLVPLAYGRLAHSLDDKRLPALRVLHKLHLRVFVVVRRCVGGGVREEESNM